MTVENISVRGGGRFIATVSSKIQDWENGHGPASYEVAIIEPINEDNSRPRRLAMRWHKSGASGIGFPNTFGKPSWFEIDPTLETAILLGLGLSAKEFDDAVRRLAGRDD